MEKGKKKLRIILIVVGVLVFFSIIGNLTSKTSSKNPLLRQKLTEAAVMNGSKTARIGTRAYIKLSRAELDRIPLEDYLEFYKSFKDKGYNWVSVICEDGTGLVFAGGLPIGSFVPISDDGEIAGEAFRIIIYDDRQDIFVEMDME